MGSPRDLVFVCEGYEDLVGKRKIEEKSLSLKAAIKINRMAETSVKRPLPRKPRNTEIN